MDAQSFKTLPVKESDIQPNWLVVDAKDVVLGRLASQVAFLIRGKHKPSFTPHLNCGDNVIVINADNVRLTGRKADQRLHLRHTGYPGGQREQTPRQILAKDSRKLIEHAVKGMLPKNKLGNDLQRNLYVYPGAEHPHAAQDPKPFTLPHQA